MPWATLKLSLAFATLGLTFASAAVIHQYVKPTRGTHTTAQVTTGGVRAAAAVMDVGTAVTYIRATRGHHHLVGGITDDTIDARNGVRDTIVCGAGYDRVLADRIDRVGKSCENVKRFHRP